MTTSRFSPFNTRIGSQSISPRYYFTDEGSLLESARGLLNMGSDVLKISLSSSSYIGIKHEIELHSLKELAASHPDFRKTFDLPFRYFMLWAQPDLGNPSNVYDLALSAEQQELLYREIYDLSAHFLSTYTQSGKIFLIGHWEADWVLLGGFDPHQDVSQSHIQNMVLYLQIRQRAVEDARNQVPHENVWVGHYAEVNRPLDAKVRGLSRMSNAVLPMVAVDLVSYSAYDALYPNRITEALDYIESQVALTHYFDDIFQKKVFIGEYDAYTDYHQHGYFLPEKQAENVLSVIASGLAWGTPFILFWEYYNNEYERMLYGGGFWLIDDQGRQQPVYDLHRSLLGKINIWKTIIRFWLGRNPTDTEFNEISKWIACHSISDLLKRFLNSPATHIELPAEDFATRLAQLFCEDLQQSRAEILSALAEKDYWNTLLACMDQSVLVRNLAAGQLIQQLGQNRRVLPAENTPSQLWRSFLDSKKFLDDELTRRWDDSNDPDILLARIFPFFFTHPTS